jgi:hypothetical protein
MNRRVRETVSLDFDVCIHEHAEHVAQFGEIDTSIIDLLHELGYAVGISTCNDTRRVAAVLRSSPRMKASIPAMP